MEEQAILRDHEALEASPRTQGPHWSRQPNLPSIHRFGGGCQAATKSKGTQAPKGVGSVNCQMLKDHLGDKVSS